MNTRIEKYYYKRNFCISLILSLCIVIILFVFVSSPQNDRYFIPFYSEPIISIIDIPITKLEDNRIAFPSTPLLKDNLLVPDQLEILEDIVLNRDNENIFFDKNFVEKQNETKKIYEASSFPFVPRQLLEVVPVNTEHTKGFVNLRILIGTDGFPKEHIVLENSTNSTTLKNITDALYKSRWQPITFGDEEVEYWIQKNYNFH